MRPAAAGQEDAGRPTVPSRQHPGEAVQASRRWIERRYDGVTLAGSDGRVYTATAHVNSHFVLIAPDFDNPVRGDEIIHVTFHGGTQGSPGYLNEHLRIRDGVVADEVTGPCDYAE